MTATYGPWVQVEMIPTPTLHTRTPALPKSSLYPDKNGVKHRILNQMQKRLLGHFAHIQWATMLD